MEPDFLRAFLALAVVVVLMIAIAQLARRMPRLQKFLGQTAEARLSVVSSLFLDARHRLVIVKIDGAEKTFLLSPETALEVKP